MNAKRVPDISMGQAQFSSATTGEQVSRRDPSGQLALSIVPRSAGGVKRIVESDLRNGISKGDFVLHYQPRVSLSDQTIVGFEALVRWNHPRYGLLDSAEFLSVAEDSRLMVSLDSWVLEEACRQMASWHRFVPVASRLTISVNTSLEQLVHPNLTGVLRRVLEKTALQPSCLRLEITERSIIANSDLAHTLRELRAMNIGLEIDDFGTGESSCNYLRDLPFDTVKIDKSFIKELGRRNDSSAIINIIVKFVSGLGLKVTAEGVEASHQLERLTDIGCLYGQGHYFSPPIEAATAERLIQTGMPGRAELPIYERG